VVGGLGYEPDAGISTEAQDIGSIGILFPSDKGQLAGQGEGGGPGRRDKEVGRERQKLVGGGCP
jgi:hypothetical protein